MGVWGTGLYAGDFAADLRSTVGAVVRLPFDPDRLVSLLCDAESSIANDPEDEEGCDPCGRHREDRRAQSGWRQACGWLDAGR